MNLIVPSHVAAAAKREARVKTIRGEFVSQRYSGHNESGREPVGDRVLILPDQAAEKSEGDILIPDTVIEKTALAAESGVLVAIGPDAFIWNSDRTRRLEGEKPAVGDRVYFARYQYVEIAGIDGRKYWLMNDNSISGRDQRSA